MNLKIITFKELKFLFIAFMFTTLHCNRYWGNFGIGDHAVLLATNETRNVTGVGNGYYLDQNGNVSLEFSYRRTSGYYSYPRLSPIPDSVYRTSDSYRTALHDGTIPRRGKIIHGDGYNCIKDIHLFLKDSSIASIMNNSLVEPVKSFRKNDFYRFRIVSFHKRSNGMTDLMVQLKDTTMSIPLDFTDSSVTVMKHPHRKRRNHFREITFIEYILFPNRKFRKESDNACIKTLEENY